MNKYYKVLEIPNNSSKDDVRKAYKKMAVKWHPDKNIDNKELAEKKFKEISEAYEILMDDNKRNNINFNNFQQGSMPRNFSDPFDIFNQLFKDHNINNIRSANNVFSFNFNNIPNNNINININRFNNPNIFSKSESTKTTFVNGKKRVEKTSQINNGKKTVIIEEDGKIISKQSFDQHGK